MISANARLYEYVMPFGIVCGPPVYQFTNLPIYQFTNLPIDRRPTYIDLSDCELRGERHWRHHPSIAAWGRTGTTVERQVEGEFGEEPCAHT